MQVERKAKSGTWVGRNQQQGGGNAICARTGWPATGQLLDISSCWHWAQGTEDDKHELCLVPSRGFLVAQWLKCLPGSEGAVGSDQESSLRRK